MECYSCYNPSFYCFFGVKERGANMYKKFNQKEAWQYIIKNMTIIKYRLYKNNIFYNEEDVLQDTIILLFNKISNKKIRVTQKGNIVGFNIIIDNAIKDILKTKYNYTYTEFPTDKFYINISHDISW